MKNTDKMQLDFIGKEVNKLYYGELPRGSHGWIITFLNGRYFGKRGNGSSLRQTIDAAIRAQRKGKSRRGK